MLSKKCLALLIALSIATPSHARTSMAKVEQGELAGQSDGAVASYLGIPYAAPPVGPNRWRPPLPPAKWQGKRAATAFGASCQQVLTPNGLAMWTPEYVTSGAVSEDCLTLNIWSGAKSAGAKLPVLVWIHGGGFSSGSGSVPIYNGHNLARRGLVVVTINYRLGLYGFLSHPGLTAESPAHASGNYGFLDQVAALHWVKDNIAAFGGDPDRVTIAGQSAGAASVHALIASPMAKGLFIRAISQSGAGLNLNTPSLAQGEAVGSQLSAAAGADLDGLRRMAPAQLDAAAAKMTGAAAMGALRFVPVVDGLFYPDAATVVANTNDVPVLAGRTADEMNGLDPSLDKMTMASWEASLKARYGGTAAEMMSAYNVHSDQEAQAAERSLRRDAGRAALFFWARGKAATGRQPTYLYSWMHVEPGPNAQRFGAFHTSEVPYVFDTLDAAKARAFGPIDRRLAAQASDYWVNFVKTGNPNGSGLPHWEALDLRHPRLLEMGEEMKEVPVLSDEALDRFDRIRSAGGRVPIF